MARAANTTWYSRFVPTAGTGGSSNDPVVQSAYGFDDGSDILHDDTGFGVPLNISGAYGWSSHPTYGGYLVLNESSRIRLQCTLSAYGACSVGMYVRFPRSGADRIAALDTGGLGTPLLTYATSSLQSKYGNLTGISRRGVFLKGASSTQRYVDVLWSDDTEGVFMPVVLAWDATVTLVYALVAPHTSLTNLGWPGVSVGTLFSDGVWFGGVPVHIASILFAADMISVNSVAAAEGASSYLDPPSPALFSPGARTSPVAYYSFDAGNLTNAVAGSHLGAFVPWTAGEGAFSSYPLAVYNTSGTATQAACQNNPGGWCHAGNANVLLVTSGNVRYRDSTLCYRFFLLNQSTCVAHTASYTTTRPFPAALTSDTSVRAPFLQADAPGSNVMRIGATTLTVPFERWTHVCASVFVGTSVLRTLYVNGTLVKNLTVASIGYMTDANSTAIANVVMPRASDISLPTVPCVLTDDVYLYGVALNSTEIAALAAAQNTASPTATPTDVPTAIPTASPVGPTSSPTAGPTAVPTALPTSSPSASPTSAPTAVPTALSTSSPSASPTAGPTAVPTALPTSSPTSAPTSLPTSIPTALPTSLPTTSTPTAGPTSLPSAQPTAAPTRTPTEWYTRFQTYMAGFNWLPSNTGIPAVGSAYGFDDAGDILHDDSGNSTPLVINGSYGWASHPVYGGYLVLNESSRIRLQCYSQNTSACSASFLLRVPRSAARRMSELSAGPSVSIALHVNASELDVKLRGVDRRGIIIGPDEPTFRFDLQWSDDAEGPFIPFTLFWFDDAGMGLLLGASAMANIAFSSASIGNVFSQGVWFGGVPLHVANLVFRTEYSTPSLTALAEPYTPLGSGITMAYYANVPVAFDPGRLSPVARFTFENGNLSNMVAGSHIGAFAPWPGIETALPGWLNATYNQSGTSTADFCPNNPGRWCHVGNSDVLLTTTGSVRYLGSTLCYRFYHVNQSGCVPHTASYTTWRPHPTGNTTHQKSPYLQTLSPGSTAFSVNGVGVDIPFGAWTHVCLVGYAFNGSATSRRTRFSVYVNGTGRATWDVIPNGYFFENSIYHEGYVMPHASDIFLPTAPCVMTDDVYLYGAALSDSEISAIAAEQIAATAIPTPVPSAVPSPAPTAVPTTSLPTSVPTSAPTARPTSVPSSAPSPVPSDAPTLFPTAVPTTPAPTYAPTSVPTHSPTADVGDVALGATKSFALRANESAPARVRVRTLATANRRSIYLGFSSSTVDVDVILVPRSVLNLNLTNMSCTSLPAGVSPVLVLALTCTSTETGAPATIQVTPDLSPLFRDDRAPARFYTCAGAAWGAVALASVTTATGSSSLLLLGVPTASPVAGTCPVGKFGCQCTRDSELASETHVPLLVVGSVLVWASSVLNFLSLVTPVPFGALLVAAVYFLGHVILAAAIAWLLPVDEYSLDTLLVSRTRNVDGTVTISGDTAFRATSACALVAVPALSVLVSAWGGLEVPQRPKWVPIAGTAIALIVPLSALARASSPLYIQYVVPGAILVGAAIVGLLNACSTGPSETTGKPSRVKPWAVIIVAAVTLLLHTGALALLLVDGLQWPCADSFAGDTRLY